MFGVLVSITSRDCIQRVTSVPKDSQNYCGCAHAQSVVRHCGDLGV